jgi:eukaryotic-like serine/threonine-protein kinase
MAVMYQHVQGKRTDCDIVNPAISRPLAAVVHKAMEVEKAKRYESMEEFRKAIEAASGA